MKRNNTTSTILGVLCALAALMISVDTLAGGYEPANSLGWPLWNAAQNPMTRRTRIWTSLGEIQETWLHSGYDFRGKVGDRVKTIAGGWVLFTHNLPNCKSLDGAPNDCRVYIQGVPTDSSGNAVNEANADHEYVYYYSHLWYGDDLDAATTPDGAIVSAATRKKLENAGGNGHPVQPNTDVSAGTVIALIAAFPDADGPYENWEHLHLGIFDRLDNYNAISSLTALIKGNDPYMYDAVDPTVHDIYLMMNEDADPGNSANSVQPSGECGEIPRDHYDIVAEADDRFERAEDLNSGEEGDDWWVPETREGERLSVHEAWYKIQKVGTGLPEEPTVWFDFDKMPFNCMKDPSEWGSCPEFTDQNFWDHSINLESGAAHPGYNYYNIIYNDNSDMANGGIEYENYLILTNAWGIDGMWDATDMDRYPDGQYQITVRALDQAGRMDQRSKLVYLGNGGTCTCDNLPPAIYVKDNPDDDGAIPSESPHWISSDIVILEHTPNPARPINEDIFGVASDEIDTNKQYDVWVRVHRLNCAPTDEIEAKVIALDPAMILNPDDTAANPEYITNDQYDPGDNEFVGFGTDNNMFEYIGPFLWEPNHTGHRCLIARVKFASEGDPADEWGVPVQEDNRYTQRNLQAGGNNFEINNPYQTAKNIEIEFDARTFPIEKPGASVTLTVEYNSALYNAWSNVPGTTLTVNSSGKIALTLHGNKIRLPAATLPGLIRLDASVTGVLPSDIQGTFVVDFSEYVNGVLWGGMSFYIGQVIPE